MGEPPPSVLWGRPRIRPTLLGVLVVGLLGVTVLSGWGLDAVAVGLMRGLAGGVLVAGLISAIADLRSFSPPALDVPSRIAVGESLDLGPALGPLRPSIELTVSAGHGDPAPAAGDRVTVTPSRRGRYGSLALEVSTAGAIGAVRLSRKGFVRLRSPLWVCPVATVAVPVDGADPTDVGDVELVATRSPELTRGVRPMVEGDLIRHAHWSATARRGSMHVREFEVPSAQEVHLVVRLTGDESIDTVITGRALATVTDLGRSGAPVTLHVRRPDGPAAARADDLDVAARTLAEAVEGDTSRPPPGVHPVVVGAGSP